jgi:4-diphosphocytidyl-2-C-methyl-D-erythritol kinase
LALPTKDVFDAFDKAHAERPSQAGAPSLDARDELLAYLQAQPNDLEAAAISLQPTIGEVLSVLRGLRSCRLARMSGSGATCFGLFDTAAAASSAAGQLRAGHRDWWIEETTLGEG